MANDSEKLEPSAMPDVFKKRLRRRTVLGSAAGVAAGALAAGALRGGSAAAASGTAPSRLLVSRQQDLPADAAPVEKQVYVAPNDVTIPKVLDFYEMVYERPSDAAADLFSDPLVRIDKNFKLIPAAALSWSGSQDGKTWTFKLDPKLVWSDGNPVTADDWVKTFQYGADPKHAWDFTWFFQNVIKNWTKVVAPEKGVAALPPDQIGVRKGADDHELIVETEVPAPYLPSMLLYSNPLSKKALETSGPLYNTKPETAVSAGPFILKQWQPDQQITYVKNEKYAGKLKVPVTRVIVKLADPKTFFTMYQNNEIDFMQKPAPAELKLLQADPEKAKEIHSGVGDFRTFYLFFDVTKAPFDNLKVRQAFSHGVDRDAIASQILGPGGTPAYSWLAPGFPASNRDGLKDIQKFDPALAKQLLADAGFPDGKGFPKLAMWLRAPTAIDNTVTGAIAAMLKQNLNVEVELSPRDQKGFMDALRNKPTQILFGYVSYGMDYLDPSNMLSVWYSGGRHSWANKDFDDKSKAAASFLGDPNERIKMFQDAERILVSDVPGVFIYHETPVQFIKPWVKGDFIKPDENGISSMHWPGYSTMDTVTQELYIGKDAPNRG